MEIAYAAGLFDGEGCVRISRIIKRKELIGWQVITTIGMTYAPIIEDWKRQFGGNVHINDHSKRNINHRPQFNWYGSSQIACAMLRQILPYLVVKREEAEAALALQASIDTRIADYGGRYDRKYVRAYRESLAIQISALKHRTFSLRQ